MKFSGTVEINAPRDRVGRSSWTPAVAAWARGRGQIDGNHSSRRDLHAGPFSAKDGEGRQRHQAMPGTLVSNIDGDRRGGCDEAEPGGR